MFVRFLFPCPGDGYGSSSLLSTFHCASFSVQCSSTSQANTARVCPCVLTLSRLHQRSDGQHRSQAGVPTAAQRARLHDGRLSDRPLLRWFCHPKRKCRSGKDAIRSVWPIFSRLSAATVFFFFARLSFMHQSIILRAEPPWCPPEEATRLSRHSMQPCTNVAHARRSHLTNRLPRRRVPSPPAVTRGGSDASGWVGRLPAEDHHDGC